MRTLILIAFAAAALFAQNAPASVAISKETALELQLLESQQQSLAAPYEAIARDLQAALDKLKQQASAAIAPAAARHNELIMAACKSAGISEDEVKAQKCVIDLKTLAVGRTPEPAPPAPKK